MINAGQTVEILPAYSTAADRKKRWVAVEQEKADGSIVIAPTSSAPAFKTARVVQVEWLVV